MNLSVLKQIEVSLCRGDKKGACLLLPKVEPNSIRRLSVLCRRYDFHEYSGFWRVAPETVLLDLLGVEDFSFAFRRAYLKQNRGKGKFHKSVTLRLIEKDTEGALEAIRTSKAFIDNRFWACAPIHEGICSRPDVGAIFESFKACREVFCETLSTLQKQKNERFSKLEQDLDLFTFISLASIYYEEDLHLMHSNHEVSLPLRKGTIQNVINKIALRLEKKPRRNDFSEFNHGIHGFLEILYKVIKEAGYWEGFKKYMLNERIIDSIQLALDYFCTFGGTIEKIADEIHQAVPFGYLSEAENVRLRASVEEKNIPKAYENLTKAMGWLKEMADIPSKKSNKGSANHPWELAGFPKEIKVGGKAINAPWLLHLFRKLNEHTKAALYLHRMNFYQFIEAHPACKDRPFVENLETFTRLSAKKNGMVVIPLVMLPKSELLQKLSSTKADTKQIEILANSVKLLLRNNGGSKPEIDIFDQPFFEFGELWCFFDFALPQDGFSGSLENLVLKSWQRGCEMDHINDRSSNFEKVIERCLNLQGFATAQGIKLEVNNKDFAEIDVLAVKGNEVLIIEAKSTYKRYTLCGNFEYREKLEEAGIQLDKILRWIEQNKDKFQTMDPILTDLKNPVLQTLIVTTSQEWNGAAWGERLHLKTSIFDLSQLMANMKVITKSFLARAFEKFSGSKDLLENILEYAFKSQPLEKIQRFWQFLERLERKEFVSFLPELNIWSNVEDVTPTFIVNTLREKVIWGNLNMAEELQEGVGENNYLPTEEDTKTGHILEMDADAKALIGNYQDAADVYLLSMKKGNIAVFAKLLNVLEKLE